ncbi:hypothetical protein [Glycomyces arizonensis]|uniref:hypothetical protein n=1 Tax=Glycomyces arizonensis TaxID=256035 RepID=UPI000407B89B|nr:hypothetical protein [Glycomyces arizonensis]
MSSTTIRHSGVLENTQSAAHLATGHSTRQWDSVSQYPPGFAPGEPWYEPAHLRHKPGDDWKIGGKPHDPDDPGPYGSPGWYQDRRTGRHRRNELPDPLPEETTAFSPMREAAYLAFIRDSEELHQAHYETDEPGRALLRLKWLLQVLLAILYWRVVPFPERPEEQTAVHATVHETTHATPSEAVRETSRVAAHVTARPAARRSALRGIDYAPQVFFDAVRTARLECRMAGGEVR